MDKKEKDYKDDFEEEDETEQEQKEKKKTAKSKRRPFPGQEENERKAVAVRSSAKKNTKDLGEEEFVKKKSKLPREMVPYIFGIIALLFALIIYFLPEKYFAYTLLKKPLLYIFGRGVYLIPLYILVLSLTWKKRTENDSKVSGIVLMIMNFLFAMSLIHVLTGDKAAEKTLNPFKLGVYGVEHNGSGFLGGFLSNLLSKVISTVLNVIASILFFLLTSIFLFGSDPKDVIKNIKTKYIPRIKAYIKKRREKRQYTTVDYRDIDDDEEAVLIDVDEIREEEKKNKGQKRRGGDAVSDVTIETVHEIPPQSGEGGETPENAVSAEIASGDTDKPVDAINSISDEDEGKPAEGEPYVFPPIDLLTSGSSDDDGGAYFRELEMTTMKLEKALAEYKVDARIVNTSRGPTVTRFELEPGEGVRAKAIANHAEDIALRLAATSIRVECPIPGKAAVGLEIPNGKKTMVRLRELVEDPIFKNAKSKLFACLGRDVAGNPVFLDIAKMPHLLIAGATGMGKSVCINSIIVSLLYRARPDEVKLILIDPKKLEFNDYNGIPHLLVPVVTEPKKAAGALNWAVHEMEKRFDTIKEVNARDLKEYNEMTANDPEREYIPQVVIIIDELADLMMTAPDDVEASICRLAQKARAAGMHLILGTQRPSVDVITGVIKANVPSRIAFTVASQIDSRTILDIAGAEKLLGNGDMLFAAVGTVKPVRVQGTFIDGKKEVTGVTDFIKRAAEAQYSDDVISLIEEEAKMCGQKGKKPKTDDEEGGSGSSELDPMAIKALEVAFEFDTISTSLLQRRLSIGYGRASKVIDNLYDLGYVGDFDPATKKRKILITPQEFSELKLNIASQQ